MKPDRRKLAHRRETPYSRKRPNGKKVWVARYTGPDGKRRYWKPEWNRGSAMFARKVDAQAAIDEAYDRVYGVGLDPATVGGYFETWTDRYPRSPRTDATNRGRIGAVLDVEIEGVALQAWPLVDLRRRHVHELVDAMLRDQGRAAAGAAGILRALSAMCEDAITDELADANPFKGVRVKSNDARAKKPSRPIRVWSFEEMHAFADAAALPRLDKEGNEIDRDAHQASREAIAGLYRRAIIRTLSDTGLRLGEVLALERSDFAGELLHSRGTAHQGRVTLGDTETKKHVRTVPVPPGLRSIIEELPPRIDTIVLFPTATGKVWRERNLYRDLWDPTRRRTGMTITPHECRHSWITHLRAAGVDDADLAAVAGHGLQTMIGRYSHSLGQSNDRIREAIG